MRDFLKWEKIPVLLSSTHDDKSKDIFYDFELKICTETGLIYQSQIPPQDILYKNARNSGVGKVWENHYLSFFNFIQNNVTLENKKICEIGSGNGFLAKLISQKYKIDCYDPCPNFEPDENINLFNTDFLTERNYDVIILSHTFEHLTDINSFLEYVRGRLNPQGKLVLSYPNLSAGFDKNHINLFNTEHISYLNKSTTERLLNKNYFRNCVIEDYLDHSLFVVSEISSHNSYNKVKIEELDELFKSLDRYLITLQGKIKFLKHEMDKYEKVYLFGCHAMSSILIYLLNIDLSKVIAIIDNDKLKQGLRLYGTDLYCISTSEVDKKYPVVLNGGSYHSEIKKDLIKQGLRVIDWKN
jgi:2-polyprenyl-3-methyl-5-hydroxy-6-metoxy-1,4-benzoquinol methylase